MQREKGRPHGRLALRGVAQLDQQCAEDGLDQSECDRCDGCGAGELTLGLRYNEFYDLGYWNWRNIVEISSGETVAYEALSRGPQGSKLERPDLLFAAARVAFEGHARRLAATTSRRRTPSIPGRRSPPSAART